MNDLSEDLRGCYRAYVDLMAAVGHRVKQNAVVDYLAARYANRETVAAALRQGEEAPAEASERMRRLVRKLSSDLAGLLDTPEEAPEAVLQSAQAAPDAVRERMADAIALNGHAGYLEPRYMDAEELDALLEEREAADTGDLAFVKVVPYLREELAQRGYQFDEAEIESWFGEARTAERLPYCLKGLLRSLGGEFTTGLIPIERLVGDENPDEWLDRCRARLLFRSHSAMHKAIAEATTLKYDCVHKALSGRRKAKRIQAEIKYCLDKWLEEVDESPHPDLNDDYRGVPVEWTCELLPRIENRFDTKEQLYRCIAKKTGIKAGSVRRYFQANGQLKYAPLSVYRYARALAEESRTEPGEGEEEEEEVASYLEDACTRRVAFQLAQKASSALRQWKMQRDNPELEMEYRQLRRDLIAAIKEGWHSVPAGV